jgi:hypothetical protein
LWRTAKKPEYLSQSGHPLLDNDYASRSCFIGNEYNSTQQPTSEYWKHIGGSFPRQRVSTEKFPAQQIGGFMTTNYPTTCLPVSPRRAYFTGSNVDRKRDTERDKTGVELQFVTKGRLKTQVAVSSRHSAWAVSLRGQTSSVNVGAES